jgi:CRISPR-associated protein (TIGR02584 family)
MPASKRPTAAKKHPFPARASSAATLPVSAQPSPSAAGRAVLLAVTGESPAILTETVWALAQENPPVLPSRIVVVTTSSGAQRLQTELLTPQPHLGQRSIWQALREELLAGHPDADRLLIMERQVKVITGPAGPDGLASTLEDLRSAADNRAAADFILEQVRAITANPDTRLIASIAGGRKTMGAMLYGAVTLLGRNQDRVTHVLVNAPFDRPLAPPFYFKPRVPSTHTLRDRDGKSLGTHSSAEAHIELADIEFVPLSNRFADLKEAPGNFAETVNRFRKTLRRDVPHTVFLDEKNSAFVIDRVPLKLDSKTANIPAQLCILRTLLALQPHLRDAGRISQKEFPEIIKAHHGQPYKLSGHDTKAAAKIAELLKGKAAASFLPPALEERAVTNVLSWLRTATRRELGLTAEDPAWPPKGKYQLPPLTIPKSSAARLPRPKA